MLKRGIGREARALSGRLCVQHLDSQPKRGARRVGDSCAPYLVGAAFLQVNSGSGAAQDSTAAPRQHSGRRSRKLACTWEGRADQVACLDVMQQSAKRACMRLTAWVTLSCQACQALQGLWLLGASWSLLKVHNVHASDQATERIRLAQQAAAPNTRSQPRAKRRPAFACQLPGRRAHTSGSSRYRVPRANLISCKMQRWSICDTGSNMLVCSNKSAATSVAAKAMGQGLQ